MPKQSLLINFQKGLNRKDDPFQVPAGTFLRLVNSIFDVIGRLTKRNGFPALPKLPDATTSYLTTFNGALQAVGSRIRSFSADSLRWFDKGAVYPIKVSTLSLIKNAINQTYADAATAPNGLVCTVYAEVLPSSSVLYRYAIADTVTGQNVLPPTLLPSVNATYGTPRVFILGNYFLILYTQHPGAYTLNYLARSWNNPTLPAVTAVVASTYTPTTTVAFDAVNMNNNLYVAYNGASASGVQLLTISSLLALSPTVNPDPVNVATMFTLAADPTSQLVWVTYYDLALTVGFTFAVNASLILQSGPTQVIFSGTILNLASTAQQRVLSLWYEVSNNYSYDSSIPTHLVTGVTCTLAGTVSAPVVTARSVGLASKAFIVAGVSYFLAAYQSPYQPTYFLIDGTTSTSASPKVAAKLAYGNGGGYLVTGLPSPTPRGTAVSIPYLVKDLVQAVNKDTNVASGTQVAGVYSQTGINYGTFDFTTDGIASVEIGQTLNFTGGFVWTYDGYVPVEQNFFLYPDSVEAAASGTSGSMTAQQYFYQVTYEWTDNQGNSYTSAPSIPVTVTLTSNTSVKLDIPTLRLTYKTANPAKISIYRWSAAQPFYCQVTSIAASGTNPMLLNSTTTDSVTLTDKLSDASILGNNILYTNGGVVEDVSPPASSIVALFDDRVWLVDAEDPDLLWFSKQVIEATPVEMSDLLTFFVAPSTGAQGSTGHMTALYPMDDKLVIFKPNAIYYINGTGPDNTGANNQYSQPIFVTSSVGCSNPRSIVLTPAGLMFQSSKGIWLLGRDLTTSYIGAPVEAFNGSLVTSAVNVPGTNQVRFSLDTTSPTDTNHLMYDYYVDQWGQFEGVPTVSSTLFQGAHTIVNDRGIVSQELAGTYVDDGNPVLMSFTTSWLNLAALQGFERFYDFYFLGEYLSPHTLQCGIAYNFNPALFQETQVSPANFSSAVPSAYGDQPAPFGSPTDVYQERIHAQVQKCQSFQLTLQEFYDPSLGVPAGAGFTLSGLNLSILAKKNVRPIPAKQSWG